jgi:hypothetical protein
MVYKTSTILIYQILYLNILKKKIEFLNIFNTYTHTQLLIIDHL